MFIYITSLFNISWMESICLNTQPYDAPPKTKKLTLKEQTNEEAGIILCMRSANERRRYIITSSLNGWAHTQNDPWRKKWKKDWTNESI